MVEKDAELRKFRGIVEEFFGVRKKKDELNPKKIYLVTYDLNKKDEKDNRDGDYKKLEEKLLKEMDAWRVARNVFLLPHDFSQEEVWDILRPLVENRDTLVVSKCANGTTKLRNPYISPNETKNKRPTWVEERFKKIETKS